MRQGVVRSFGPGLHKVIGYAGKNRFISVFVGCFATIALQSSFATAMLTTTFLTRHMIMPSAALAVILGADVGTTLVAQVLTFDLFWLIPILFLTSYILSQKKKNATQFHSMAYLFMGLGLMLLSLNLLREASEPLKNAVLLPTLLSSFQGDVIFSILMAAALTWLMHSSLAMVLLLAAISVNGVLPEQTALFMVLGANLGGAFVPVTASLKEPPVVQRVLMSNFLIRFLGVIAASFATPYVLGFLNQSFPEDPARQIVMFHTAFNAVLVVLAFPFTSMIPQFLGRFYSDQDSDPNDPSALRYIDPHELDTPPIALSSATRESLRLVDIVQEMLDQTMRAFETNSLQSVSMVRANDNIIDTLYNSIKHYLADISKEALSEDEAKRHIEIFTLSTNLEHAGDIIDNSLIEIAEKKINENKSFSAAGWSEIKAIHNQVQQSLQLVQTLVISHDVTLARQLLDHKTLLRRAEQETIAKHFERIRAGVPETIATSSMHLDIVRDYRRINSHICAIASHILDRRGELMDTRLETNEYKRR